MINNSYSEWQKSPVSTSITTHPLDNLNFPTITVCPPKGSNTALYPDLMKADNDSLSDDDRQQLMVSIKNIAENVVAATNPANLVRLFKGPSHPRLKMASKSWWVVLKDLSSPLDLERVTRKMILRWTSLSTSFLICNLPYRTLELELWL